MMKAIELGFKIISISIAILKYLNMKTKMKIVLLGILCCPIISQAQVSPNAIKQFPAHIVYKIDDIVSKVNLTEDKQIKIGQKLITADSLATISLAKGGAVDQLKSYYTIDANFLKPILSTEELEHYGYIQNKENRFLVALEFAKDLKLDPTQISEIRKQNDFTVSLLKMSPKETFQLYNTKLNSILTKEQYVSLLKIFYQEQSIEDAKNDWKKIKLHKLVTDKNEKIEFTKIVNYYLGKNSFLDKKAEQYDKKRGDFLAKKITLAEPPLLIYANILSEGSYKKNRYASVIKYGKELELTKPQIDSLLLKYRQHERIILENTEKESILSPPKIVPSEYDNIAQILNSEQINKWLVNKNKNDAKKEALRNWVQLEEEGLTKDLDKNKTLVEFSNYQLKYLVTKERAIIYHTQENIFLKRDVEQKKPELLKQLDAIARSKSKNTTIKNALTW